MSPLQLDEGVVPATGGAAGDLVLRGVSRTFGGGRRKPVVTALGTTDLALAEGSFVSIVGRSGCGKSTLLRILAGLTTPTTGQVLLRGRPVAGPPGGVRFVFQDYGSSLFPWKTVAQNVRFGLRHAEARTDRDVQYYLDLVDLGGVGDRHPWELSGGMQQRVAIARALASGSKILLLDEPFSAIDALSRSRLQDVLQRIWDELGLTIVFVTHDIDEAIYLSDRVVVLAPAGGGVQADIAVDIARPRRQVQTHESAAFLAHRRDLAALLLGDAA